MQIIIDVGESDDALLIIDCIAAAINNYKDEMGRFGFTDDQYRLITSAHNQIVEQAKILKSHS